MLAKFGLPPLGTLYAPNLTPGGNIDDWSDGELVRAICEGVGKDGRSLLIMPSSTMRNLSDEDVLALVAYLRSQPATGSPTPATRFSLFGAVFTNLADFRTAQPPAGTVIAPPQGGAAYGKYMVSILDAATVTALSFRVEWTPASLARRPARTSPRSCRSGQKRNSWDFFNTGTRPDGTKVPLLTLPSGFTEPQMPWPEFREAATDDELKAMYAYLHSLPPVESPAP